MWFLVLALGGGPSALVALATAVSVEAVLAERTASRNCLKEAISRANEAHKETLEAYDEAFEVMRRKIR